ncbi:YmdB family metallophosphoesterase [bacterium]|nr:YmdB family metallophosphoesterase [bacterium]
MTIRILVVGDVMGRLGRRMIQRELFRVREEHKADLVIVNGENASGGFGLSEPNYFDLKDSGADIVTLGDHWLDQGSIRRVMSNATEPLVRPANYPMGAPGQGVWTEVVKGRPIRLVVLQGRVFMREGTDNPFACIEGILEEKREGEILLVEFHAEATSEKQAMQWFLDGNATACWGTHTHVATADERIFPKGLAGISDIGMTGALDSVIGVVPEISVERFRKGIGTRFSTPRVGSATFQGALITVDSETSKAVSINRIRRDVTSL